MVSTRIKIDDISEEASQFAIYDLSKINKEFDDKTGLKTDIDGNIIINDYHEFDGEGYLVNDLWRDEYAKFQERLMYAKKMRLELFNKLIDDEKSFIILIHTKECGERTYSVLEGAEKILKQSNYSYLNIGTPVSDGDDTLQNSKLDISKLNSGSVAIIKNGELYVSIDPDNDSIKSYEEVKNWLSKYIDIQ